MIINIYIYVKKSKILQYDIPILSCLGDDDIPNK
jgi:hypothetical protein